jgi:hypothetical protein
MRRLLATAILLAFATASCDKLLDPSNSNTGPTRYIFFKYTAIPDTMTDAAAMAQIYDTRDNFIRHNFTQRIFPVTDSMVVGGNMVALNRIVVTLPGTGTTSGEAELHGGADPAIHPFQAGIPSSLTLHVTNGHEVGQSHYTGSWELQFGDGTIIARNTQTGTQADSLEYHLDSYDATTSYATGKFLFIARNVANPQQRWAIFDGEFALTKGRN